MKLTEVLASFLLLATVCPSALAQWDPNVINGQVIVHLFEWTFPDIAAECENFLAPKGFGGVQVSPVGEYIIAMNSDVQRPWWERYQPVSYEIISRSGNEADFIDMVQRCNAVGVRIYVDVVFNHMTGGWPSGTPGIGGTSFDYEHQSYPGVPYTDTDFNDDNCYSDNGDINDYNDAHEVRNCRLEGMNDLNQRTDYVREKISEFLNRLIDIGVAGLRVDACKHMYPGDLDAIFSGLNDLNTDFFPAGARPFIFQEVIDMGTGEPITAEEYTEVGRVTEFKYGKKLGQQFRPPKALKWLYNFGEEWGMLDRGDALVFIDNHDNQRHGDHEIITFREPRLYKMANAFMLGWPYGFTRVMSSYYWDTYYDANGHDVNDWYGPPHDDDYNIESPEFAHGACSNDWMCEHRWRQITNMVEFRNVAYGTDTNDWWDNGNNQIAWGRGDKGFVAINNDAYDLKETLQTGLAAGTYCDVISGGLEDGACTGKTVTVGSDRTAYIEILTSEDDGVLAIHANSKL